MNAYFAQITEPAVLVTLIATAFISYWIGKAAVGVGGVSSEQERADLARAAGSLTPQQKMEIDAAIDARKKIEAIRIFRAATGLGLKQSKLAIDARIRERNLTDRP